MNSLRMILIKLTGNIHLFLLTTCLDCGGQRSKVKGEWVLASYVICRLYLHTQDVRGICESFANKRGLPNYPHGIIFTFWEQYVSLRFYLTMAVVAALAAIFVTLAVVLLNVVAAFIVVRCNLAHSITMPNGLYFTAVFFF